MDRQKLLAVLVTHLPDVRWLCGFTGSNAALVALRSAKGLKLHLFTDGRYTAQADTEVQGARVRIAKKNALAEALLLVTSGPASRCGFDATSTTVQTLHAMNQVLLDPSLTSPRSAAFLKPTQELVANLRQVKDPQEIDALRRAAALGCTLYEGMLGFIETGMRERDVAAELEHRARLAGAEAMSFETIVAGGVRSAMSHARATDAVLKPGTLLTMDFGVVLDGYCSDMTRTVFLAADPNVRSSPAKRERLACQRHVFDTVLQAQEAAVASVRAGLAAGAVDNAARSVLKSFGLAKTFTHSTGHGLGLEIHEGPRIGANGTATLQAGMTVTIEPGAYLPGEFGVRIEDTVLVTSAGCEILTPAYKGWVEL